MITFAASLKAWGRPAFDEIFKSEAGSLENTQLPLQQGLSNSSYVSDSKFKLVILKAYENSEVIIVKTGVFYAGIIAGCNCADDPTPVDEITEYCDVLFQINKRTAETEINLIDTALE